MDDLLPCPFCGSSDIEYDNCDHGSGKWYYCNGCGLQVKALYSDDLKAMWNRRADIPYKHTSPKNKQAISCDKCGSEDRLVAQYGGGVYCYPCCSQPLGSTTQNTDTPYTEAIRAGNMVKNKELRETLDHATKASENNNG